MARRGVRAMGLAYLAALGIGYAAGPRVESVRNGYSIELLEDPAEGSGTYQTLTMLLAPSQGRAPNVNVRIEAFDGDVVELATVNRLELVRMGWEILAETRPGPGAVAFEFTGLHGGEPHHWYCRLELKGGRSYVVTATAPASQWAAVGARLRACVDSFRLRDGGEDDGPGPGDLGGVGTAGRDSFLEEPGR